MCARVLLCVSPFSFSPRIKREGGEQRVKGRAVRVNMRGGSVDTADKYNGTSVGQENMADVRPSCEDVLLYERTRFTCCCTWLE